MLRHQVGTTERRTHGHKHVARLRGPGAAAAAHPAMGASQQRSDADGAARGKLGSQHPHPPLSRTRSPAPTPLSLPAEARRRGRSPRAGPARRRRAPPPCRPLAPQSPRCPDMAAPPSRPPPARPPPLSLPPPRAARAQTWPLPGRLSPAPGHKKGSGSRDPRLPHAPAAPAPATAAATTSQPPRQRGTPPYKGPAAGGASPIGCRGGQGAHVTRRRGGRGGRAGEAEGRGARAPRRGGKARTRWQRGDSTAPPPPPPPAVRARRAAARRRPCALPAPQRRAGVKLLAVREPLVRGRALPHS